MKDIHRSRRFRLPRRRYQLNKPLTSSDEDDDDEANFQQQTIARSNKNANRTATTVFETIPRSTMEVKPISSDPSSLFLYSIHSEQKPTVSHSDLTPLSRTATNTTSLTVLPHSDTKMTDTGVVKIDLTDLSESDVFDSSSPTNSDHLGIVSVDYKISQIRTFEDLTHLGETDVSVKSIIFSKDNLLDHQQAYPQHQSCITIPNINNEDPVTKPSSIVQINETMSQQSSIRWNLRNMTMKMKLLIGCSSLSLIAGILLLVFIL